MIEVNNGDPAGQARVETLALAVALRTWAKMLSNSRGRLVVRGDALGVLHDVTKLRARDPILNSFAHTMALTVAPLGCDLRAAHVWSERNVICDQLSRKGADGLKRSPSAETG